MTCYRPLDAWQSKHLTDNGKTVVLLRMPNPYAIDNFNYVQLPCGKCIGCRLERSRNWAIRCMHEASFYEDNAFITLTYDKNHLPADGSLDLEHFQKFMKRLRKKFPGVRYYMCGEYGEKLERPHFHACLFNIKFPDLEHHKTVRGNKLFVSKLLNEIWGKGFCVIGSLTFESAAYVARYVLKKAYGDDAAEHYISKSGRRLRPEFTTMSRRPGIGSRWIQKYTSDVYPHDRVLKDGFPIKPPRFYDKFIERHNFPLYERVKTARVDAAEKDLDNNTPARLAEREHIKNVQVTRLKRNMESEK